MATEPMGRPVSVNWVPPPLVLAHCTPRLRPSPSAISTMIASTSTWARRMSSLATTCSSSAITSGWAVITSALVVSSAEMASLPPPMLAPPPPVVVAAPPFLSASMLELTPLSTSTRSLALPYFR